MKVRSGIVTLLVGSLLCGTALAAPAKNDGEQIRHALTAGCVAFANGDRAGAVAPFLKSAEFLEYDFSPPRSKNYEEHKKEVEGFFEILTGKSICEYLEITPVILSPDSAYSIALMRFAGQFKDGRAIDVTFRSTDVWRKVDGTWRIVHEHNSFPVDPFTGKADLTSSTASH
nr:DUF4440 domain-containing protein [Sphingomonas sp. CDS-1]